MGCAELCDMSRAESRPTIHLPFSPGSGTQGCWPPHVPMNLLESRMPRIGEGVSDCRAGTSGFKPRRRGRTRPEPEIGSSRKVHESHCVHLPALRKWLALGSGFFHRGRKPRLREGSCWSSVTQPESGGIWIRTQLYLTPKLKFSPEAASHQIARSRGRKEGRSPQLHSPGASPWWPPTRRALLSPPLPRYVRSSLHQDRACLLHASFFQVGAGPAELMRVALEILLLKDDDLEQEERVGPVIMGRREAGHWG